MSRLELAWAAGLFDGEGNAGTHVSRTGPLGREYLYLTLQIGMADRATLERFAAAVGHGTVKGPYHSSSYKPHHAPMYRWSVQGRKAEAVANKLLPFLSPVKSAQVRRNRRSE